jgi:DNA invertase Pin-like site-specific DNA recombinase
MSSSRRMKSRSAAVKPASIPSWLEGIAAAKDRGVYKGGKPRIDAAEVRRLIGEGVGVSEVARRLGITRTSVYRLLGPAKRDAGEREAA